MVESKEIFENMSFILHWLTLLWLFIHLAFDINQKLPSDLFKIGNGRFKDNV